MPKTAGSPKQASRDWAALGCQMMDARRFREAIDCFQRLHLANGRSGGDSARQAIEMLLPIAKSRPEWSTAQFSLGCAFEHVGDFERARAHLQNTLRLDPSKKAGVETLNARMFWMEEKWREAVDAADRALAVNPGSYLANWIRGQACCSLGWAEEAVASLRRATEIYPNPVSHSFLLSHMNCLGDATPEAGYAEACRWNALYAAPLGAEIRPHTNSPDPNRRIKIGYVSPDLHTHAIMKFVPALLEHHDRSQFEVFVYAVGRRLDDNSEAVKQAVDHYAIISEPYRELARRVREEGIDLLVDLAGHTMGMALLSFALRPAPVQVSWIGYLGTTGMPAMDYFLGDQHIPCRGTEGCFSEKVYRLPRVLACYRPPAEVALAPPPCLERGYIVFGCFNNPSKITRQAAMLWSAILHLVPNSRLLLKYRGLDAHDGQMLLRRWFQEDGISPERILFEGPSPPGDYLEAYNRIDIALDPFPYNGGTTTLDALWMGVPVVTLAGRLTVQCHGVGILTGAGAGLRALVAETPEQYLQIALALTATVRDQPAMRASIRQALVGSPWMDEIGVVRDVENAFRDLWRTWCKAKTQ